VIAAVPSRLPAAIATPRDFQAQANEAFKTIGLDARQKGEISAALTTISGKDSTRADSALAHLKALSTNPDTFENARIAYVHAAEEFAKTGDWNKAWESGVKKMLNESGYSPDEISAVVDRKSGLKFYQHTAHCLGI